MILSKLKIYIKLLRVPFFTASLIPIALGTALAYSTTGLFSPALCILALFAMICFQAGANITNDYFDHISRNDWLNENTTPFSGGSRVIQKNLLTPGAVLKFALGVFTLGSITGIAIVIITKSFFILLLGITGLFGAYFYTANPLKFGYRTTGEITIALLFGIIPVYGAWYIQTLNFNITPLLPGLIVAMLIFEVILANEFADYNADKAVNKKTIVVTFGVEKAVVVYKTTLFLICLGMMTFAFTIPNKTLAGLTLLITVALAAKCLHTAKPYLLKQKGNFSLSKATVLLHLISGLSITAAVLLSKPR